MCKLEKKIKQLIKEINSTIGLYIKNISSGEKIIINGEEIFHAASIIKIPILWEALKQVEKGEKNFNDVIILRNKDKVGGCGVLSILHEGIELTLEDILHLMIDISDNTATNMLIDYLGKDKVINFIKIHKIDLKF